MVDSITDADIDRMTAPLDVDAVFSELDAVEEIEQAPSKKKKEKQKVLTAYKRSLKESIRMKISRKMKNKEGELVVRQASDKHVDNFALGIMQLQGLLPANILRINFFRKGKEQQRFRDVQTGRFVKRPV